MAFLNANISKTKQQRYGFLFIFRSIASKYICIQKNKEIHRTGQLDTSGFKYLRLEMTNDFIALLCTAL